MEMSLTQQQSNPNEEFTAAEKQLISIPMAATMLDTDQVRLLGENYLNSLPVFGLLGKVWLIYRSLVE